MRYFIHAPVTGPVVIHREGCAHPRIDRLPVLAVHPTLSEAIRHAESEEMRFKVAPCTK